MAKREKKDNPGRRRLVYGILWLVLALLWVVLIVSDVRWQTARWLLLLHALCVLLSLAGMLKNLLHFLNLREKNEAPAPVPVEEKTEEPAEEETEEEPAAEAEEESQEEEAPAEKPEEKTEE